MSGGFGFSARRLNLTSYETVLSGYVDERGERQSLFGKRPGETEPILLESLLARQREQRGIASSLRGMPLGLTPLTPEHIQLVETWIAQGHPR
jgi:hypothetical protein